jgi:leader peptidase (prepilin peptidase) / N-methyltransferase
VSSTCQAAGPWLSLSLVALLLAASLTDLRARVIPNRLVGAGALAGLGLSAALCPETLPERGLAVSLAGLPLIGLALVRPQGFGMGDAKLACVIAIHLGRAVAPALLVTFAAGAAFGLAIVARQGAAARRTGIPFAPFLALGGATGLLAGDALLAAYLEAVTD